MPFIKVGTHSSAALQPKKPFSMFSVGGNGGFETQIVAGPRVLSRSDIGNAGGGFKSGLGMGVGFGVGLLAIGLTYSVIKTARS